MLEKEILHRHLLAIWSSFCSFPFQSAFHSHTLDSSAQISRTSSITWMISSQLAHLTVKTRVYYLHACHVNITQACVHTHDVALTQLIFV